MYKDKNNHHENTADKKVIPYEPKNLIRELHIDYAGIAIAYDLPLDTPLDQPLTDEQIASLPLPAEDKELSRNIHWRNLANLLHMEPRYRHIGLNIMHISQQRTDEKAQKLLEAQTAAQGQCQLNINLPDASQPQTIRNAACHTPAPLPKTCHTGSAQSNYPSRARKNTEGHAE